MFIRGEAMGIGVPLTDAEAAILSWLVEVYIGLCMCTSIRAISERILLHCSLTSTPGHHASRRWIVEKAIAAMHDAMQDDVAHILYLESSLHCCLTARTGKGITSMSMPFCLFSLGLAQEAYVKCSLVWWMWRVVMHRRLQSSWNVSWCHGFRTAISGRRGW